MSKRLKILLYVIAAWMAVIGTLFLFLPKVAEMMFATSLPDRGLAMLFGQSVLTIAFTAFLAARDGGEQSKLSLVILVFTIGHVLVFAYQLITSMAGFMSVGIPLIVNAIFSILLFLFRKDLKK
jgi:hypothetical protein